MDNESDSNSANCDTDNGIDLNMDTVTPITTNDINPSPDVSVLDFLK